MNIVITSDALLITVNYNDYSADIGRTSDTEFIREVSVSGDINSIELNLIGTAIPLSFNSSSAAYQVDTINGVAPGSQADLLVKLKAILLSIGGGSSLTNAELRSTPLPVTGSMSINTTGLATDVNQVVSNTSLASIDAKLTNPLPVSGAFFPATQPVSGTFFQATQPVSGTFFQATQPVSGTFFQATQPISIAAPIISKAADLQVANTAAAGSAVTVTLPAAAALFHYITHVEIECYSTAARTGGATPVIATTTNIAGSPSWNFASAAAVGTIEKNVLEFSAPIRTSVVNTATTIVCPATASVIWKVKVFYYTGT